MAYQGEDVFGYRSTNLRGLLRLRHTRKAPTSEGWPGSELAEISV
jgi:hypothetical protein